MPFDYHNDAVIYAIAYAFDCVSHPYAIQIRFGDASCKNRILMLSYCTLTAAHSHQIHTEYFIIESLNDRKMVHEFILSISLDFVVK